MRFFGVRSVVQAVDGNTDLKVFKNKPIVTPGKIITYCKLQ